MYSGEKDWVLNTVRQWVKAYETRDLDLFKKVLRPSEKHISWGTGKDEKYVGVNGFLDMVQRDFEQSEGARLKILNAYTVVHETWAWVAAELEPTVRIDGEDRCLEVLRGTLVLAKVDDKWLIEHTHGSWPYAQQATGQSFPN